MTDIIRTYAPDTDAYKRLELAGFILHVLSPNGTIYKVEDVYFDLGQNWMWTTLIAYHPNGSEWQAFCPRDYEKILLTNDMVKTCREIVDDKYWYDP